MSYGLTCPTSQHTRDGKPHAIIGCGSTNVSGPDDEGFVDCLACGIWFDPSLEPRQHYECRTCGRRYDDATPSELVTWTVTGYCCSYCYEDNPS